MSGRTLLQLFAIVLGFLGGVSQVSALPAATWLVAIGNNRGDADELPLRFAERDAQQLAEVLRQQGGVPSRRTTLLLGEDAGTVRRTLEDLNAELRGQLQSGQPSALIVYYSGHADATTLHLRGSGLALAELKKLVEGSAAAVRLLVVDACRSGSITRVKGVTAAEPFVIQLSAGDAAEGMAILTSSAAGESSQESDRLRGSFFSHHLLGALRGAADGNGDGRVTLSEAYSYTYEQTLRSSGQTLALQHPTYAFDVKGHEDLVLSVIGPAAGPAGRLRLGAPALYLIAEERAGGPVVAEVSPSRAGAILLLPEGRYFVEERRRLEYREYQVQLVPGGTVELAALPYRTVQYDRLVRHRGGSASSVHGLSLLLGGRGEILGGEGPTPQLHLGYGVDLPWLSVAGRLRGSLGSSQSADGLLGQHHYELGLGLLLARFVDLRYVSVAFALVVEAVYHRQSFDTARQVAPRSSLGFGFGGLLTLELPLRRGVSLHLEGGPQSVLFRQAETENGAQTGQALRSPLTFGGAGGVVWRL
jgi:hypothetical protein